MSKIVKSNSKLIPKVKGYKITASNEDKDTNEEDDDIQNFDSLELQKKKKNKQSSVSSLKNAGGGIQHHQKVDLQDISFMEEELEGEEAHTNQQYRRHAFKNRNRQRSSSSEKQDFVQVSSSDSAAQSKMQKNNLKSTQAPPVQKPNQFNQQAEKAVSSKQSVKVTLNAREKSKNQGNPKTTLPLDKQSKKVKRDTFEDDSLENEKEEEVVQEKNKDKSGKSKSGMNNKENVKNYNEEANNKAAANSRKDNQPQEKVYNVKDFMFSDEEIPERKKEQKQAASSHSKPKKGNKDSTMQMEQLTEESSDEKNVLKNQKRGGRKESVQEEQQEIRGYSPLQGKSKVNPPINNIYESDNDSKSDCFSMQPQGSLYSKSLSIGNLQDFNEMREDDSVLLNYINADFEDEQVDTPEQNPYQKLFQSPHVNNHEDEEDSDHIKLKKKPQKDTHKGNNNIPQSHALPHKSVVSSDSSLLVNQKENSHTIPKASAFSKQKNAVDNSFHAASANQLGNHTNGSSSNKRKDAKTQIANENGLKQGSNGMMSYKNEELVEIDSIDEEIFEVNELPKDKTRVLWIFNSLHFIEKLTNNGHYLEGQEIKTQNSKMWQLQVSYSEKQQQIECVFSRLNKEDTSKQQLYYVFKFYALSKTEGILDKSYNGNKTFSQESPSQSFTFPLDIELILEKYQHIIFELTLTPLRLQHYNSKEETNYVGLQNEGQTCYMNSYLQTLFHIKAFVQLVYSIPTEREVDSVFPHSLQVLFYQLQSRGYHCTTAELLKSFSWDRSKARIQQDVQEFSCLFIEYLESKAEKIPQLKGQIKHLFQGKIQNYIKCINVEYESLREESFFEISLNLKGCNNIYESLDDYVKEELLEKDNKYDTGDQRYQKQDAKKGIKILQLPPVIFFHLKRFQFDYQTGKNVKIVDQHEYYEEIDMTKYIANPSNQECYKYRLFAVLVHSGDFSSSGHYYAYIRPDPKQNSWYKFNDTIVERASKKQALDNSFGGKAFFKCFDKSKKQLAWESSSINSTAYMLVYINTREIDQILGEIPIENVPKWVIEQEDQLIQDYLLKQKLSKIVQVKLTSFDLLKKQQQTCGVYFQKLTKRDEQPDTNESIICKKEVDKNKTYKEFYNDLCEEIGVEPEDICLWKIDYLSNGCERISNQIKKLASNGSDLIEKAYLENSQNQTNSTSSSSMNQSPSPIFLILPVSTTKFGGNKQIFQVGQDGQLEIKKHELVQQNGEKKVSSQNDWNKYFSFQEGTMMLIIIKSFEYTKDGVKIQFIDYIFYNSQSTFSQLSEEISKKKRLDLCEYAFYKEENYSIFSLSVEVNGQTQLKNVFNSTDYGVLVIAYESKLAKDNNVSIVNYYKQLEDQVRVKFVSAQATLPASSLSSNNVNSSALFNSSLNKLNNSSMKISQGGNNNANVASNISPFMQEEIENNTKMINYSTDSISFLRNFSLSNLVPLEGVTFEKIFLKTSKYSQLQKNIFNSLKEYFREQLKLFYPSSESPNSMESEEVVKSSTMLVNATKKQLQNMNLVAIEQFLNLDDSFYEYIFLKCKMRKRNIEEIPFFQSTVSETSLNDLMKHFDNTIVIHFDFSKALRARDRDQKLVIEYVLYSTAFNKVYPNQVVDIEKTANVQALGNLLKQQKFFKEYLSAEQQYAQNNNTIPPSTVKICQLSRDNPNRIELYYPESAKLNTIKKNQLIRIELHREIQESEILFVCHQTTKNGVETFDNPFSFPLQYYNKVKELKNRVVQILSDRQIIFDGKKIEFNRDNIQIILYSEYSKYDSTSLQVEDSNEKSIKHEIDTDSFKNKCGFLEIQHINLISATDSKAIKFDMN